MSGVPRIYEKLYARIVATGRAGGALNACDLRLGEPPGDDRAGEFSRRAGRSRPGSRCRSAWRTGSCSRGSAPVVGGRVRFAVSGSAPLGETLGCWFYGVGMPLSKGTG